LQGKVRIDAGASIGPNCVIVDSAIGEDAELLSNCVIESSSVGAGCQLGPFSHLRPGTVLSENVKVGNFVEIKNSTIGSGSKVNHLSYVGDTSMGSGVNIGAGTITANYDGANKHRTVIGDNASTGANSVMVAPVTIEKGATIGAGSVITKTAPEDQLTLTRAKQVTVEGWQRPTKKK
jgi:bifunctional UDP-N-acetylglucosamine pyrophosphorylase/glucosamine-1-phosphate N-acetyltransferase